MTIGDVFDIYAIRLRGSQNFSKGGGFTLCQSEGSHQIVMSFLPPVVGCLLKKRLTKRGGEGES